MDRIRIAAPLLLPLRLPTGRAAQALLLATSLALAACENMSTQEVLTCVGATALTTTIGAVVGGGKGAAGGAAVGVAACVAIHFAMHQTKDASQVDADYRHAHGGQLPAQPQIVKLDVQATPSSTIRKGGELTIVSNVEVVSGKGEPLSGVTEEIRLYEYGKTEPFKTDSKNASAKSESGGYQTSFTISLPDSMPQGRYRIETAFYLNKRLADTRSLPLQVV
ncbi:hypothetical protein [Paraburkholderia sp. BCC1886]|uniref:hypothetical protein n=1 Tax=Paraburkholderia sp. BCC1886 TaxID=2562670 RepID=UPI001182B7DF|nr:hypothetical protein [Paraburkholderia sp. BCC1886]